LYPGKSYQVQLREEVVPKAKRPKTMQLVGVVTESEEHQGEVVDADVVWWQMKM
jgi:hypothetical protein